MKEKIGAAFFCLLFAVAFGGVGVFATWAIAATIHDGLAAREWVRVKASVESFEGTSVRYRYAFQGRDYVGTRIGASPLGGTDNIDDWTENMHAFLASAKGEGRPITVLVNPEQPAQAMIDGDIRWNFLVFLLPFSLAFGGVGVGALYALYRMLRGKTPDRVSRGVSSDALSGVLGLWAFAFFWNAISFPIALLFVPRMIDEGEWVGLLVMLFPLIGLFVAWAAVKSTFAYLRRGAATLHLREDKPRIGSHVEGTVDFARGVNPGDAFHVSLLCRRSKELGDETNTSTRWTKRIDARATTAPGGGARVAFRFEIPAHLPATTTEPGNARETFQWRVEVDAADKPLPMPYGFDIQMRPAPAEARAAAFADEEVPAALGPGFEGVEKLLGLDTSRMSARQREALATMTPEQRAALAKVAAYAPAFKKVAIAVACVFAALIAIPFVIALITGS